MAPGLPLPGQTVMTSGAVPEANWVRICCWYWSAPAVVRFTLTPGFAASNALTTSSIEPWSTDARVRVLELPPPEAALVPPLQAATMVTAVSAAITADNLRRFMKSPEGV